MPRKENPSSIEHSQRFSTKSQNTKDKFACENLYTDGTPASEIGSMEKYEEVTRKRNKTEAIKGKIRSFSKHQFYVLATLCYGNFCIAACVSLQAPFFPREAEEKGATPSQYGLVFGVFELTIIVASPICSKLLSHVSPNFLISAGLFFCGTTTILFGLIDRAPSGTPFIALSFTIRIVEGLGSASFMTAANAVCAGEFHDQVAMALSTLHSFFGIGLIVGPTLGGGLYQVGGFSLPFAVLGSLLLLGIAQVFFFLPQTEWSKEEKSGDFFKLLANFGIIANSLVIISSLLSIGFNVATLEPHLRQFDLKGGVLGTIFIINGGIYAFTTPIFGWICDKGVSPKLLCMFGSFLSALSFLFIGPAPFLSFSPELWLIVISLLILGLGLSAKIVPAFYCALRETIKLGFPDDFSTKALVSAIFSSSISIGAFIGPTLGGYLLEHFGYRSATVIIFIEECAMLLLLLIQVKSEKRTFTRKT
ncbi:MFS-type transporter SLC18B1-like isoform X1 [Limulus polyphemus]|uniref:MFS-type transporter SLC18B1-like isoform X1 n=1 Tax=Limulus polyphemus TaxID=6850 RepID=A0ABM1TBS1_LIMPO|nr:MFS-type transporter SLC18B1-like isoform X1 [Limulus polyphemus]XP_022253326.1 MFS-type transporter SLC18B1-like isoform X1 [Limulus polyphemus]XP_022253327.1 MFS-type transporter SLC18B1-like isoform X1 [Limulus polyphemus]